MEVGTGGVMSAITTVYDKDNIIAEIDMEKELQNKRYRIRKLTPRECFRLMDLNENDIDKIQASGISESQQYKMAGNSIVVACMVGIFTNLFSTETIEQEQLTLF
jgi:DNA (cytosine-5)-methyltransferase 1